MISDITVNQKDVQVTFEGAIYVEEATVIREKLISYIDQGYFQFVMDFQKVNYIDSSGLGVLVALHKRAVQNNGFVKIKGLNGSVKELFELTRLTKVFIIE